MNNKFLLISVFVFIVIVFGIFLYTKSQNSSAVSLNNISSPKQQIVSNPLSIQVMRDKTYPGSNITIENTLSDGVNYHQYIASYISDGFKIYALLTVPIGDKPKNGWPAIVFNHGYIPPDIYQTTERYVAYVAALASHGFIVFKPDYRGNGQSEGQPEGAYYSPSYSTDVLNALASIKKYKDADPNKIGMWGHSMGGNITLRDLVVDPKDIKAAVIWGGVVGSYDDLMNNWQRKVPFHPSQRELSFRNRGRQNLVNIYKTPSQNPTFWQSIDPTYHLENITAPIQLHTGGDDEEVPPDFSVKLYQKLQSLGKTVEYYNYPGGDHNISSPNFEIAMQRTLTFFDKYLKGGE